MKKGLIFVVLFFVFVIAGCDGLSIDDNEKKGVEGVYCKLDNPEISGCISGTDYVLIKRYTLLSEEREKAMQTKISARLEKWENEVLEASIRELDGFGEHEIVDLGSAIGSRKKSDDDAENLLFAWRWRDVVVLTAMPIEKVLFLMDEKAKNPTVQFKYSMSGITDIFYWGDLTLVSNLEDRRINISHPSELVNQGTVDTLTIRISPEQFKSGVYIKTALPAK